MLLNGLNSLNYNESVPSNHLSYISSVFQTEASNMISDIS